MVCDLLAGGDLRYHLQQQVSNSNRRTLKTNILNYTFLNHAGIDAI